jgi:hypothetical protein
MSGKLLHGIHKEVADVVVRNLTDGGAKVRLTSPGTVDIRAPLTLRVAAVDRSCAIAWRSGDEVGLRFV